MDKYDIFDFIAFFFADFLVTGKYIYIFDLYLYLYLYYIYTYITYYLKVNIYYFE